MLGVSVMVGVAVGVAVQSGVGDGVALGVTVGLAVGVDEGVSVGSGDGVGVVDSTAKLQADSSTSRPAATIYERIRFTMRKIPTQVIPRVPAL